MRKVNAIAAAIGMLLTAAGVWAQDDAKLKALAAEKAAFEAQTARDTAEAAAITAAAVLAKAKASTTDADTNALAAKAARDQAETAALTAAKALADAKTAAANQDAQSQKSQLDADAALTTSKVTAQTAELAALKSALGAVPSIGSDGNVAITESTTGMLLESKSGSLKATGALAARFCEILKARGIKGAFIAPADLDRKIVASALVLRDFKELSRIATTKDNLDLVGGAATQQVVGAAAILSAVSMLQYGAGAVQSIAKLFRSDYAISLADGRRETWLEYFMAASCPEQLPRADVETAVRAKGIESQMKQLNDIARFMDAYSAQKAAQTAKLDKATADIKAATEAKKPAGPLEEDAKAARDVLNALAKLDGAVARMKTLLDGVTSKPDAFIDAVAWDRFASEYQDPPRISMAFTTQDGQVTRTHWLTGKHVYGRSSGELVYRVVKKDGTVVAAGYLLATNSDGELDFKANATPQAAGLDYPLPAAQ